MEAQAVINVVVVSHRGAPVGQPMSAQFGPAGGTIGRAPTNTLVLDDPDRTVSRVHAQVECRGGKFFILDRGSNPLQINGQPLGTGREAALGAGDRLVVGGFELTVQGVGGGAAATAPAPAAASAPRPSDDDPFADLLAGLGSPTPPVAAPSAKGASPSSRAQPDSLPFPDPMAHPAGKPGGGAPIDDPFADLLGPGAAPPPAASGSDDFSGLGLQAGPPSSIEDLFGGLGGSGPGSDPFGDSPLGAPLLQPNMSSNVDPLAALQATPKPVAPPRSDHLPIGQFGYTPPKGVVPSGASSGGSLMDDLGPAPAAPAPLFDDLAGKRIASPSPDAQQAAEADDDDPFANLIPGPPPAPPAPPVAAFVSPPAVASRTAPAAAPLAAPVAASRPAPAAPAPVAAAGPAAATASDDVLFAAFLRGVNSKHQMPTALTPELMERIGALLRTAAEGTLQLLHARTEVKRGVQAEVTMIAAQANNPLKFSPTAEVALAHLLGAGVRGFMGPEEAMRDAYDDLRAHEFGVMVGMRAALAHVLARFTPAELEKKIVAKSAFDALFTNRKAKLWDEFVALYGTIAAEAEDDFHSLFGKAFVQAYDEQMARLKSGR
ncbi:type VI secretion system-associated FHA domain protein TagH [Variovorax humicola]|uniref:Type VI secretion system-associated FHA domain protein TagH n=1 Tax=Variovorax humicola TaxID=1769758 RepID=A0ABU8W411_9BURK